VFTRNELALLLFMTLFAAAGAMLGRFRHAPDPVRTEVRPAAFTVLPVKAPEPAAAADSRKTLKRECVKININRAGLEEVKSLPGIGPALGQRILDLRARMGGFKDKSDLLKVKGLGEKKLQKIGPLIDI
jgi:competence ComEA-like helix-hairpin-helix protein